MQRFKTLLLREWMQHQRGWWMLMAPPFLLVILAGLFGQIDFDLAESGRSDALPPVAVALAAWLGLGAVTLLLGWTASMLQSPGLARRDQQDRSIEFWLSLPIDHAQGLGATLLMHLVLWPWLALLVGMAGGALASLLIVSKAFGVVAWFALPWTTLVPALALLTLRLMLGVLLATLWLSPLILGTMAASAWFKRWGVVLAVAGTGVLGLVLDKVYANPVVWQTLQFLSERASRALLVSERGGAAASQELNIERADDFFRVLGIAPGWLLHDAGSALLMLASPAFAATAAGGAAAFGLLWLRRARDA
jgi:ABC-2 type transport system permease protein